MAGGGWHFPSVLLLALLLLNVRTTAAFAQGQGGTPAQQGTPGGADAAMPDVTGRRISAPGMLLDDYNSTEAGTLALTFGAGYARVRAGHDTSLPFGDIHFGVTRRLDVGVSTSLASTQFGTFRTTAPGDSYISAKIMLVTENPHRPGIAFQPVLEVLGRPSLANNALAPAKVNGAFGGIIGKSLGDNFRIYNHSGYFTRGIVFSSAALEITRFSHITPVVFAGYGRLTQGRETAASLGLNSGRPDVGATLGVRLSPNCGGYVSAMRSIGRRDDNSIDFGISGGITYSWRLFEK